ncbi:hypothetical protein J2S70_000272 [Trueperella bonasi]|uniref:Uncharacterized protein n=1 Tax=Trueperella bonasi TaxID=312286 RepID=A0ABT9NEA7_9ACTO|nr:hypothetical protein [Trueperella bonasi]MDP9805690.1 hypothetical protein [Trueperella bonasi]
MDEMNLNTQAFWRTRQQAGYTKVAQGYAALTSDKKDLKQWDWQLDKHLHLIDYLSQHQSKTAIADTSAAILWGLPILNFPPKVVERDSLTNARTRLTRNQRTRRTEAVPDVMKIGNILVTTIEQTIVDIACQHGGEAALIAADFALHNQLTSLERIEKVVRRQGQRAGIGNVRDVLKVADGRVESPAESRMRWRFYTSRFIIPEPQVIIISGGKVYRVDGYDAHTRTVYEAVGKYKYALYSGGQIQAFFEERNRDPTLRSFGFAVHRAQFDDVVNAARFQDWLELLH